MREDTNPPLYYKNYKILKSMKYCNNCKTYRDSWADKTSNGASNRCWFCDNYSLTSTSQTLSLPSNSAFNRNLSQIRQSVNEVNSGQRAGFATRVEYVNTNTGEYICEILQYDRINGYLYDCRTNRR